ncbi:putative aminophospholipid-translocase [Coelomomyces lativittatus]|nr:putative aminophospholipid-translocase [Coelomomyces lativittatus]
MNRIGYLITYVGPLVFVLLITMLKEAVDEYKRYKRDQEINTQPYRVLHQDTWKSLPSSQLQVGHVVVVEKNQRVPADLIVLRTKDTSGTCFIRTDNLDGETDWKLRVAVPFTQQKSMGEWEKEKGSGAGDVLLDFTSSYELPVSVIEVEPPNKEIDTFQGNFTSDHHTEPLSVENVVWMNTVIASDTIVGCVIYTGTDTSASMNTTQAKNVKMGLVDLELNRLSKVLCVFTLCLAFIMIMLAGFHPTSGVDFIRFIILFSCIIPISLRVNLDMGKLVYSYFINNDAAIPNTLVRNSTLPEELGRIQYLLTDKTGTLTKNEMEVKKFHVGTMSFGADAMYEAKNLLLETIFKKSPIGKTRVMGTRIRDLVLAIALCHNVTPIASESNGIQFQASSPDEVALVQWASAMDVCLVHRDLKTIRLLIRQELTYEFEILHVFPFTSESKRMGVLLRDTHSQEVLFYQKGADTVMSKLVQYNDWLDEECDTMAREGLRTLVIARKRLSATTWSQFQTAFHEASTSMKGRSEGMQRVVQNYLEYDLELLGVTGVEDKLQDDVRTTLETLRNAGIRIWMLTGDKLETATCIALSSKLISRRQSIFTMSKDTIRNVTDAHEALHRLAHLKEACLIIDGIALALCMEVCLGEFLDVATQLPAVICCRCSPTQKASITQHIKLYTGLRVAAIGDGGNDVSMIRSAHVGIGVVGKEGKQASLAADFSMTQFSHLSRLILWHGRNSYQRSAKLSHFVIHRGLIISIMQAVFSSLFYFAPIALYQGMIMLGYTSFFTSAPVFSLVLDTDVTPELALLYPELFKDVVKGRSLSSKTFVLCLMISVYQGGAIMLLATLLFEQEFVHIVSISFTALIFNELLMVALEITTWHRYMLFSLLGTLFVYIFFMLMLLEFDLNFILSIPFVWKVLIMTAVSTMPLIIIKRAKLYFAPPNYQKIVNYH